MVKRRQTVTSDMFDKMKKKVGLETSLGELEEKSKEHIAKKNSDVSKPRMGSESRSLLEGTGGDEAVMDYDILNQIILSSINEESSMDKLKNNYFWLFVFVFSVGIVLYSFSDALMKHGYIGWDRALLLIFPIVIVVAYYVKDKTLKGIKKYPTWVDVNNKTEFNFRAVREDSDTVYILPFTSLPDGRFFVPKNPFDDRRQLVIAIDKDCLFKHRDGIITLGNLGIDRSGKASLRVEIDPKFVPNPDQYIKNYKMRILKLQLDGERYISSSRREMAQKIASSDVGEWIDYLMKINRQMLPITKLQLRHEQGEGILNTQIIQKMLDLGIVDSSDLSKMSEIERLLKE